jgi:hypothetical protein
MLGHDRQQDNHEISSLALERCQYDAVVWGVRPLSLELSMNCFGERNGDFPF